MFNVVNKNMIHEKKNRETTTKGTKNPDTKFLIDNKTER